MISGKAALALVGSMEKRMHHDYRLLFAHIVEPFHMVRNEPYNTIIFWGFPCTWLVPFTWDRKHFLQEEFVKQNGDGQPYSSLIKLSMSSGITGPKYLSGASYKDWIEATPFSGASE